MLKYYRLIMENVKGKRKRIQLWARDNEHAKESALNIRGLAYYNVVSVYVL